MPFATLVWRLVCITAIVLASSAYAGRLPVYELYDSDFHDRFYTTSLDDRAFAISLGYIDNPMTCPGFSDQS